MSVKVTIFESFRIKESVILYFSGSSAGAVDEEFFIKSFEDAPKVQVKPFSKYKPQNYTLIKNKIDLSFHFHI